MKVVPADFLSVHTVIWEKWSKAYLLPLWASTATKILSKFSRFCYHILFFPLSIYIVRVKLKNFSDEKAVLYIEIPVTTIAFLCKNGAAD